MLKIILFTCLINILSCGDEISHAEKPLPSISPTILHDKPRSDAPNTPGSKTLTNPVRILSLDGGGIRCLISLSLLEGIEEGTGKKAHELFDIIAGTGSGGLIALASTTPQGLTKIARSAREIRAFIENKSQDIFTYQPLASVQARKNWLHDLYGNHMFKDLLKTVVIPAIDLNNSLGLNFENDLSIFNKLKIRQVANISFNRPGDILSVSEIKLNGAHGLELEYELMPGDIYKNNPALLAIRKAQHIYGLDELKKRGILLISLGTGEHLGSDNYGRELMTAGDLRWASILPDALADGSTNEDDAIVEYLIQELPPSQIIRLQPILDVNTYQGIASMNDISQKNINNLLYLAKKEQQSERFKMVINLLKSKTGS